MLHLFKYIGYVFRGGWLIATYPFQARKYIKNKEAYSLQERYTFVRTKASKVLVKYLGAKLEIEGLDKLNKEDTYLFVPNHQGLLDPVCLINIFEQPLIFVSKKEVEKTPIIGKINYIIDSIFLDRENLREAVNMVKLCRNHLTEKRSVVIFPEGTRSKDEEVSIQTYKPGALKCAYNTGAKIVPVVIDRSYILLSCKKSNGNKIIKIRFLDPISSEDYEKLNTTDLALKIENDAKKVLKEMRK